MTSSSSACWRIRGAPTRPTASIGSASPSTPSSTSWSSRRNLSDGASLTMRAYLLELDLSVEAEATPASNPPGRGTGPGEAPAWPGARPESHTAWRETCVAAPLPRAAPAGDALAHSMTRNAYPAISAHRVLRPSVRSNPRRRHLSSCSPGGSVLAGELLGAAHDQLVAPRPVKRLGDLVLAADLDGAVSRAGQRTDLELLLAVNLRSAYSLYAVLRLPQPSSEQTSVTPLRRGIAERATGPVTAPEHVDSRRF